MLVVLLHLCVGRPGLLPSNAASSSCITTLRNAAARGEDAYGRFFFIATGSALATVPRAWLWAASAVPVADIHGQ